MNITEQTLKEGTALMCGILAFPCTGEDTFDIRKDFLGTAGKTMEPEYETMHIKHMRFHTDWNWLHAVIDEIHESYAEVHILRSHCRIVDNGYNQAFYFDDPYTDETLKTIDAVFLCIVDYLKWLENDSIPLEKENYQTEDELPF